MRDIVYISIIAILGVICMVALTDLDAMIKHCMQHIHAKDSLCGAYAKWKDIDRKEHQPLLYMEDICKIR